MSTFIERYRKKKEEEEKSNSKQTVSESFSDKDASSKETSFIDRYRAKKTKSSIDIWGKSANQLATEVQDRYKNYINNEKAYTDYSNRASELLGVASDWRNKYADNEEMISYIDEVVSMLENTRKYASGYHRYYSRFGSENDFNKHESGWLTPSTEYDQGKVDARKGIYEGNQSRISEIDGLIKKGGLSRDEKKALKSEKSKLEDENRQYERTQGKADSYVYLSGKNDFENVSADRSFKNPTEKDFKQYDSNMGDYELALSNGGYLGEDGKVRDIAGRVLADKVDDLSVDKLGLFLSTSDEDIIRAYNELSATNGNYTNTWANIMQEGDVNAWKQLTEEEINWYYYLFNKEGQDKANKFLEDMASELTRRETVENTEYLTEVFNNAGFLGKVGLSAVTIPVQAAGNVAAGVEDAFNLITGQEINPYSRAHSVGAFSSQIRQMQSEEFDEWTGGAKIPLLDYSLGDAYQAVMSAGDMLTTIVTGPTGYAAQMGLGAFSNKASDLYKQGASMGEVASLGAIAGIAEGFFEKYSMDKLINIGDSKTLGQLVKNVLIQSGIEASEEMATEFTNIVADGIIRNGTSEWNRVLEESNGNVLLALGKEMQQIGKAGLSGAIAGALGGGTSSIVNFAQFKNAEKQQGQSIIDNRGYNDLRALAQSVSEEASGIKSLDRAVAKAEKNTTAKNVGRLSTEVETVKGKLNKADIQNSLEGRGMSKYQASKAADAILNVAQKQAAGVEISQAEYNAITKDKVTKQVYDSLISDPDSSVNTRNTKYANARQGITVAEDGTVTRSEDNVGRVVDKVVQEVALERISSKSQFKVNTGEDSAFYKGKTTYTNPDTGETKVVKIEGISTIENGELMLKLEGGETVNAEDVRFSNEGEALVYSTVLDMGVNAGVAEALVKNFKDAGYSESQAGKYVLGMKDAYSYGRMNIPLSQLSKSSFAHELSNEQVNYIYKLGQNEAADETKAKQKTIDEKKAKAKKVTAKTGKVIVEDGVAVTEDGEIDESSLTDVQKANLVGIKALAELSPINFHIFQSQKVDGKWVATINGEVVEGSPNGVYFKGTNDIWIDLNAGDMGEGTMLWTAAHEISHYIKERSPAKWKAIADFLMKEYSKKQGVSVSEMLDNQKAKIMNRADAGTKTEIEITDEAYEELVSDALADMLTDGSIVESLAELKKTDKSLWQTIKDAIADLLKKWGEILGVYKGRTHDTAEAQALAGMEKAYKKLQKMYAEAFAEANEVEAAIGEQLAEAGIAIDDATGDLFSVRNIPGENGVPDAKSIAKLVSEATGRSYEESLRWVEAEFSIANIILGKPEFLDFDPDTRYDFIKKNSDYPQGTVDPNNLCRKREEFTVMFDMLQRMYPNKTFTALDVADMRHMLDEEGITVACGACFVEDRRQLLGEIADTFIGMWKEAAETGKPLQKTNASGVKKNMTITAKLAKTYGLTKGATIYATDKYIPNQYDLTTYEGFKKLEREHPMIAYSFIGYNNSRGQQAARLIEGRAEYSRQILNWSDKKVQSVNNQGGLRIFSFSDFQAVSMLDIIQVIIDCSARGVKIQGYTKVPEFAKLIRNTGIKMNRSLMPKGETGLKTVNGKKVLDYDTKEGIDINDEDFLDEADNPNVGNILVGINAEQISIAFLDDFVDYIIPFHTNKSKEVCKALGLATWQNYKESQHEKDIASGKASKHNVNIYTQVIDKYNPTNKVEFVDAFLKECRRQKKIPRYAEFLNKEYKADGAYMDEGGSFDYTYREGYHKLLVDFKMFDKQGNILPQGNVTPDMDSSFMETILAREVEKKEGYKFPQKVFDRIQEKYGEKPKALHSDRNSKGEALTKEQAEFFKDSKVRDADGNLLVVYHGTYENFTIFDIERTASANDFGKGHYFTNDENDARMNYASAKGADVGTKIESLALLYFEEMGYTEEDSYSNDYVDEWNEAYDKAEAFYKKGKVLQVYLNMTNPLYARGSELYDSQGNIVTARSATYLKELGYDGIIDYSVSEKFGRFQDLSDDTGHFIVFDSEQIKLTTNTNPTSNPDIRYSERNFSYDELVAKDDLVGVVLGKDVQVPLNKDGSIDRNTIVSEVRKKCQKIQTKSATPTYFFNAPDIGRNVEITDRSITHGFFDGTKKNKIPSPKDLLNAKVSLEIGEILANSIEVNRSYREGNRDILYAHIMVGTVGIVNNDGETEYYAVRSVIEERTNLNPILVESKILGKLHAINAKKIDSPNLKVTDEISVARGHDEVYAYSVANFLKDVKNIFDDTFSNDVYQHFGLERTENEHFSKHLLYSERNTDSNRSLLANALETTVQNEIEANKLKEYKDKIALIDAEQQRLSEINAEIRELSFSKGPRDNERLKALRFDAVQAANRINTYDKQLLNLESTKVLKRVLEREKALARKRQKQKNAEVLKEYREKFEADKQKIREKNAESRKKATEGRNKTVMKHKIRGVISELNSLFTKGNKEKNIKKGLQETVATAIASAELLFSDEITNEMIVRHGFKLPLSDKENGYAWDYAQALKEIDEYEAALEKVRESDGIGKEQKIREYLDGMWEQKKKLKNLDKKLSDAFERERISYNRVTTETILKELASTYAKTQNAEEDYLRASYDDSIRAHIENLAEYLSDEPTVRDMSLDSLQKVYKAYRMVLTAVKKANTAFKAGKAVSISTLGSNTMAEVEAVGGSKTHVIGGKIGKALSGIKSFDINNLKPVHFFERIGSKTLSMLYENVRKGEDVWAVDITEAKEFKEKMTEKYGADKWDYDKPYTFKSSTGKEFTLNLEQMMSLYAFSKRSQAVPHLEGGGFVFDGAIETYKEKDGKKSILKYRVNTATAHKITQAEVDKVIAKLSKIEGAIKYVDEMQDYLSTVMGAKGNEVSMEMYGVDLFNEKFYFPLKSAKQYMFEQNEAAGEVKIKNSSFSKETKKFANNPIILSNFMDVWANHVNDMSMYHAFVLPLEDFNRVYNYSTPASESLDTESVKQTIQNAYEAQANQYISQLLKDLNGGARVDPRESIGRKMIGTFKKAKVFGSLSVVIQQPSAVARALAEIDAKYFDFNPKLIKHKQHWEELKKYAPVAIIKEMGHFDTDMGMSSVDYIRGDKTAMDVVDDIISKPAAYMDELTWIHIWTAVKRETMAKNKGLKGEEMLKKAGERFTEVISKTQVYDSVLSRSANMRSKSMFMNMLTSFMAEPTTSINMLENAVVDFKRGKKGKAARTVASVAASVVLNSVLVSFIYAARDDEEDETYLEKYLGSFATEIVDGINPITYYPILKDIWSIAQGYEVKRSDMTLIDDTISTLKDGISLLSKDTEDMDEDELAGHKQEVISFWHSLAGKFSSLVGLPVDNLIRDVKAVFNVYNTAKRGQQSSLSLIWDEVTESVKGSLPVVGWLPGESKQDKLYDAIVSGDAAYIDRLKRGYKDEPAYINAVSKALRENDPRIKEAAEARYGGDMTEYQRIADEIEDEGYFEPDTILKAIKAEYNDLKPDEESSGTRPTSEFMSEDIMNAIVNGDTSDVESVKDYFIDDYIADGKTQEEAEKGWHSKVKSAVGSSYKDGEIDSYTAESYLKQYTEMTDSDIYWAMNEWNHADDEDYSKYGDFYSAVESGKDLKTTIKVYLDNGVSKDTLAKQITTHFKPIYREMSTSERASLKGYLLNAYELLGKKRGEKSKDINDWLK